jgi:hypothetical protein
MSNTSFGVISVVAPLMGAWLAGVGYHWLFLLSGGVNLVGFVLVRWWVKDPRLLGER